MLPIGDDQHKWWHFPIFNILFIILNVAIFIYQVTLPESALLSFIDRFATTPTEILAGNELYTLITSMFLHGSWMHLIGNMLFLYVFGDNIEARMGNFKYLLFYLLAWVVASLWHVLTNMWSDIPSLWASSAISWVLGLYLVLFPTSRIKVLSLNYYVWTFLVPAKQFLIYRIVFQLISAASAWTAVEDASWVAWFAHIGGLAFGWIWGLIIKKKKKYV